MKKITFLLVFISIFGYSQTAITDANIQTAVDLWISDSAAATTTYGAISDWDVSQVTDMSELFGLQCCVALPCYIAASLS